MFNESVAHWRMSSSGVKRCGRERITIGTIFDGSVENSGKPTPPQILRKRKNETISSDSVPRD